MIFHMIRKKRMHYKCIVVHSFLLSSVNEVFFVRNYSEIGVTDTKDLPSAFFLKHTVPSTKANRV